MSPRTLLSLAGREPVLPVWSDSALVLIDYQNEYLAGALQLPEAAKAIAAAERVLWAGRVKGARVIHVLHKGGAGGLFDRAAWGGQPIDPLKPEAGEAVVEKSAPSSFFETDLAERLGGAGASVVHGFHDPYVCLDHGARGSRLWLRLERGG